MPTGVTFQEKDQSVLIPVRPGGRIAIVGPFSKGPIGRFLDIDSSEEFRRTYGGDYASSECARHCVENLDAGAKLRVSRVVHATDPDDISTITAVKSTNTLVDRAAAVASEAVLTSSIAGPWFIPDGTTFTLDVNGTPEATETVSVNPASVVTANDETTNYDFTGGKTLEVKVGGSSEPTQILSLPAAKFAIVAAGTAAEVAQAINDENPVGMSAKVTGVGPNFTVTLESDVKGTGAKIQVIGGTANAELAFPTTEQTGSGDFADHTAVTPAELNTFLQGANHGVTYNNQNDADSVSFISVATGAAVYMGFDSPSSGAAIIGLTEGAGGDVNGTDSSTAENTLRVDAINEGVWADGLSFDIQNATSGASDRFNLLIPVQTAVERQEFYENLSMDPLDSRYVVNYVNARSRVVVVTDLNSPTASPNDLPLAGSFTLAGGNDGLSGLVGNDFLGGSTSKLGVHALDNGADVIDLFTPTIHEDAASGVPAAMTSILQYAEDRRDMVYHMSPPNPSDSTDSIAFRNGTAPYSHQAFDSSYGSLIFGTGEINLSTGPKFFNALSQYGGVLSFTDTGNGKKSEEIGPWFGPAGDKNGRTKFQDANPVLSVKNQNDATRQSLEDAQMNYIGQFGSRFLIWNQATLQKLTSALSDLNVRRSMIFFEQQVSTALLSEAFSPNDPIFFRAVFRKVDKFFRRIKRLRGVFDYAIFCDQEVDRVEDVKVNTPEGIDEGTFVCKIFIKPTRLAKEIQLIFTVTATGVSFEEVFEAA